MWITFNHQCRPSSSSSSSVTGKALHICSSSAVASFELIQLLLVVAEGRRGLLLVLQRNGFLDEEGPFVWKLTTTRQSGCWWHALDWLRRHRARTSFSPRSSSIFEGRRSEVEETRSTWE